MFPSQTRATRETIPLTPPYFNASAQDVHKGLPLQIFRVVPEASPIASRGLGTKAVLGVPDLPRVFVCLAECPCSVRAGVAIYPV